MESYAVPQREVQVRVRLLDGRDLSGHMYAPSAGPDGEPGHLIDRLNDDSVKFLALNDGATTHLIHTRRILTVEVAGDEVEERAKHETDAAALSRRLLVKLHLPLETEIIGHLTYVPLPEHARLQDCLNHARRFIPMVVHDRLTYVNRGQIVSASALRGEQP